MPATILPLPTEKPWWQSVTILTLLVSVMARILAAVGIAELTQQDEVALVALIGAATGTVMDAIAMWGRIRARSRITSAR